MSQPSKEYMERYKAENKERLKALQKERDRRKKEAREADPVAMAEYRKKRREEYLKTRPLARTREEIAAGKRIKRVIPKDQPRVCVDCGTAKPLDEFPRHGPRGRKEFCIVCSGIRAKNYKKTYKEKKAPKPVQRVSDFSYDDSFFRTCTDCGSEKEIRCFPITNGNRRLHRCKACCNTRKSKILEGNVPISPSRPYIRNPGVMIHGQRFIPVPNVDQGTTTL